METNIDKMKDLRFDSSLSSIDAIVTSQEYKEQLLHLLKPILEARFPGNIGKQQIRPYRDRISFACPYCGDSMKSNHKKRGSFILEGKFKNFYKCHNCEEFKRIDKFFEDFKINLDLSVINYIAQGIENFGNYTNAKYDMSLFVDMDMIDKYAIDRQEFLQCFGLSEVKESPVWSWLKNRLQYDDSKFMYNAKYNYILILNLTPSGRILGAQKRFFRGENKYLTYKIGKLYEAMKKDPSIIPDEIDTISQLFNICLLDYSKPITLFEGPFDAFLFRNSCANAGANKSFPIEIPLRFFYDDDKTGIRKSIEKINEGDEVFLWSKLKADLELPYRKKWDLNDLLIYLHEKGLKAPNFNDYFSDDELDIIDI